MNRQGNFPEQNDLEAQKALDEIKDNPQHFWDNNRNQIAESNDSKQTKIQADFLEDSLNRSAREITDLSLDELPESDLDNLEIAELGLFESNPDNTQDLLPFVDSEPALDDMALEEMLDGEELSNNNLEAIVIEEQFSNDLDNLLIEDTPSVLTMDSELSVPKISLDYLDRELELSMTEPDLDIDINLDNTLEDSNLDLNSNLDNLLDDSGLDNNLDLDNLLEDSNLDLNANLDNLLDDSGLDNNLNLDNLLEDSNIASSLESLDLEIDSSLDSVDTLNSLDNLLNDFQAQPVAVAVPTPVKIQPSTPSAPAPAKAIAFDQTMRVSVRKLDNLNNLIGELVVKRNRLEEDQERIRRFMDNLLNHVQSLGDMGGKMHDLYERSLLEGALMASRQQSQSSSGSRRSSFLQEEEPEPKKDNELDALELDRFTGFHLLSQDIIELIVRVREAASDIQFVVDETDKVTRSLRQVTSQLQDGMNSSRMVAFGQTTDRLPRAIRDISRKLNKQVNLQVEGKDVLIDKMIVENLYNPMTHLVNNAITHGIESAEERTQQGKPAEGTLNIRAFLQGNQTVIAISDDGAGINPDRVKEKAVEKSLLTWAQAQKLSKPEIYELIFRPGFSTKDQADDFAGRGVGMDVVSTDLKKIRGTIGIESQVGKGTIFTIRLPLVLSICKAISCVFNNTRIAFPLDGVEAQKEFSPSEITVNENGVKQIPWNNTLLPFQPLSNLLSYNRQISRGGVYNLNKEDDTISVVILRSADNILAVEVEQILGEQEIVIKQMEEPIPKPAGIAGATVLGDGIIMPIADVLELIEISQGKRTIELGFNVWQDKQTQEAAETVNNEPTVLVVDDSITVRELLTLSFNKLGYRVEQARDGQEGWDKLRGGLPCDMIFSDIEMPRMNGLELLSNLQRDEKLKRIPVAMLTSRGADKHRQLASELGAQAYLTKPYTERDLMDVAQKLIEIHLANKEADLAAVSLDEEGDRDRSGTETVKTIPSVLIIDDSVTVRELLSMSFRKAGYQVEQARDGKEAWDKLREGLECDIAFCDIEMPRMNGLELLANLQQHETLSQLPIAMLTSRGAQKMRNIAAQRGAKGYFVKPYVEETLLDAAKRMMEGEVLIDSVEFDE